MEIWIREQLISIVASSVLGIISGISYDILKIFYAMLGIGRDIVCEKKRRFDPRLIVVFMLDFVFCLLVTAAYAIITYAFSYGQFRWYMLVSATVGFAAYMATLGRITAFFTERIARLIRRGAKRLVIILFAPLKLTSRLIVKGASALYVSSVGKIIMKLREDKRRRYTEKAFDELHSLVRFE